MIKLRWKFRNGHEWENSFRTESDAREYWHRCGLLSDPNIVKVWIDDQSMRDEEAA
jgi:hypothetical protein